MNGVWVETPEPDIDRTFLRIRETWPELTRPGSWLAFPLPHPYVRPGGFFKMFVYWDSYFILLGLVVQGEWELAAGIVDNMISAVERVGHVPGYISSKTTCRSRSQSPYLTAAISEVLPYRGERWLVGAAAAAEREYQEYWCAASHLTGTGLSRYADVGANGCTTVPDTPHYRSLAESGWDNTPRFGTDATQVVPVDLNAQLYRYEEDLGTFWETLGQIERAQAWRERAAARRQLIDRYLWAEDEGLYRDLDVRTGRPLENVPRALSSFVPLWAGVASESQAARLVEHLLRFEHDHGLAACEPGWTDATEHNHPAGWAYSHWYVAEGLRRYGYRDHAVRISLKWLRLVAQRFEESGALFERYNVVDPGGPTPARYPPQEGFGWTNGVFAALLTRVVLGIRTDASTPDEDLPAEWNGLPVRARFPSFPWPSGAVLG
jgi:alpha,alpha-trehalase